MCFEMTKVRLFKDMKNVQIEYKNMTREDTETCQITLLVTYLMPRSHIHGLDAGLATYTHIGQRKRIRFS